MLIREKGPELSTEELARKVDNMYCDFENMLGRNMIDALPVDKRSEYLAQRKDGVVDFEKIGQIFGEHISNPDEILKKTMREFATLFSNSE
jgi:hypothetical protein